MTHPDIAAIARGQEERHDHRCNCEWCWLGVTNGEPPAPRASLFACARTFFRDHLLSGKQA